ncbi:hypothetical protein J5N97_015400 [Dioscorea zingiberensis]|uniref:Uncharacterized protein n=1 Tax=Dioscorea zingiberensis TaxID=325984 RepID=A0A9D5CU98_9LILI|nr:hypothetical protein J5N97_015400 [Dioscorea zingiberensis]
MLLPFLQGLCQRLQVATVAASDQLPLGVHEELGRLLEAFFTIQETTLEPAEDKPINKCKAIQSWLCDLQQAAYDAVDFLNCLSLRPPKENDMQDVLLQPNHPCLPVDSISPDLHTQLIIKDIRRRIEELVKEQPPHAKIHLHDLQQSDHAIHNKVQSLGIPPNELRVLGRDEDREKIIQLLTSEESSQVDLSLIAIVGQGGVGKTTLARLVYDDERVASHFQLKFWVTASEIHDTVSLLRSTALLLEDHELDCNFNFSCNEDDWEAKLKKSRFLLVLDDFRCGVIGWKKLRKLLKTKLSGNKILITVEEEDIPKNMGLMNLSYHLKDLSHEDSWSLFKECAFHDKPWTGQNSRDFEEVGMEIVAKLEGLPLAARMIGSLLCSNVNLEDWKMILNADVWKSKPDELHGIPAALWLSYQHLPPHIKACFSYCSVFPGDHRFIKESLVHMWIAQGLIQPQEGATMESLAGEYFDYLLHRFFFWSIQHNDIDYSSGVPESKYIVMHKMIRRLAMAVTLDESLCLLCGADRRCSQKIHKRMEARRHLYLQSDCLASSKILGLSMLGVIETLVFHRTNGFSFNYDALFKKLKSIRVLYLSDKELNVLPKSIAKLQQLRCLDLSNTSISMLPKELCSLLNLQTLRLTTWFYCLPNFPNGMSKLISLRHLIATGGYELHKIGRLTGLQELEVFTASRRDGYKIEELKYMNQLSGQLCISHLKNVHTVVEAKEAMLNDKKLLGKLELQWPSIHSLRAADDLVLEALKPHPNLKELSIANYLGTKTPSWLEDASLCNLEFLSFRACQNLDLVLGRLQSLKTLRVIGSRKLQGLRPRAWNGGEDIQLFPHLCVLEIKRCSSLVELIPLPPTLEKLKLEYVGLEVLPGFQQSKSSTLCFSLSSLHISGCPRLTTLQMGLLEHQNHQGLQVLHSLRIIGCPKLVYLPDHGFSSLVSLKYLHIENCEFLGYRPVDNANANLPSSLIELKIIECPRLTNDSFLEGLERLHSLTCLVIRDAIKAFSSSNQPRQHPQLRSLPGDLLQHLKALEELEIANCEGLELLGFQSLVSLKKLKIYCCPKLAACSSPADTAPLPLEYLEIQLCSLVMFTDGVLRRLTSLVVLKLMHLRKFKCFPKSMEELFQCLVSLKELHIYGCSSLQSLPDDLASIPSLKELYIVGCYGLQCLPEKGVPPSLELLVIQNCSALGLRCQIEGEDWPKISHVFFVQVDGHRLIMPEKNLP